MVCSQPNFASISRQTTLLYPKTPRISGSPDYCLSCRGKTKITDGTRALVVIVGSAPLFITGLARCVAKAIYRGDFATGRGIIPNTVSGKHRDILTARPNRSLRGFLSLTIVAMGGCRSRNTKSKEHY